MTPPRYYSYDPDQGLQWWDTEEEAREAVADAMRHQRAAMAVNGGWSGPDIDQTQWGAVVCAPRQTMREIDLGGGMVDYALGDVKP
jgi:hypothetical protein